MSRRVAKGGMRARAVVKADFSATPVFASDLASQVCRWTQWYAQTPAESPLGYVIEGLTLHRIEMRIPLWRNRTIPSNHINYAL